MQLVRAMLFIKYIAIKRP